MEMIALAIVDKLLEAGADPDSPEMNMDRFMQAIGAEREAGEQAALLRFKRAVRGYIKWAHTDEEQGEMFDPDDLLRLRRAKTFEEAAAILAQYETQPSFMYMVSQGYFV